MFDLHVIDDNTTPKSFDTHARTAELSNCRDWNFLKVISKASEESEGGLSDINPDSGNDEGTVTRCDKTSKSRGIVSTPRRDLTSEKLNDTTVASKAVKGRRDFILYVYLHGLIYVGTLSSGIKTPLQRL
ncbi:unnamed protein product [Allacma fusca]|uniref:Uncharacterized protein n=1 Tax=Allacma fusca TaxID=39272 RepID=A0A8J2P3K3_9HEXA|nr:unnamed protein product [Allacma fusca]